jgi:hypothetical protein
MLIHVPSTADTTATITSDAASTIPSLRKASAGAGAEN